ncbi:MAG: helix-turn-helix domain-containing protein, partial [Thermoleophilaceae bacterium]
MVREGIGRYGRRLNHQDRLEVLERISRGETRPRVAGALGTTERTVGRVLAA